MVRVMGNVAISLAEKRLLRHLSLGGRPDDEVGKDLISKFATKVWTDSSVAGILRQHGVTIQELATMYLAVIDSLMPTPWMNAGGPLLVPTQWFMEPHRIDNLLVEIDRDAAGLGRDEWLARWISNAKKLARATKEVHDERFGCPSVHVSADGGLKSSTGCAGALILIATTLAAALLLAVLP
jgi:hypothetical protein